MTSEAFINSYFKGSRFLLDNNALPEPACKWAESKWLDFVTTIGVPEVKNRILTACGHFEHDLTNMTRTTVLRKTRDYGETTFLCLTGESAGFIGDPWTPVRQNPCEDKDLVIVLVRPVLPYSFFVQNRSKYKSITQEHPQDWVLRTIFTNLERLGLPYDEAAFRYNVTRFEQEYFRR